MKDTNDRLPQATAADRYREAGVDIEAGYEVQRRIKADVASTRRPGVLTDVGGFGGLFDLSVLGAYDEPVLVSGTDGVGTKLFLAFETQKHDSIGIDVVAMCVNDVLVQGAEPLFFLDYLALHQADPALVQAIVSGVAAGCKESGCALIGGETAEMNDLYAPAHYDIAGFSVGIVEKSKVITGDEVKAGDVLLGLSSSGVHSNGFSLLRKVFFKDAGYTMDTVPDGWDKSISEELLTPTRLYVKPVLKLLETIRPHGMAHVTGGGFYENLPRMSQQAFSYVVKKDSWPILPIFTLTAEVGGLSEEEMFNVFNMGIGFVLALDPEDVAAAQTVLADMGQASYVIGNVEVGQGVSFV